MAVLVNPLLKIEGAGYHGKQGVKVDGRTVRLEAARSGCYWKTSRQAVARFLNEIQPTDWVSRVSTPVELDREADRAMTKMRKMGIKC